MFANPSLTTRIAVGKGLGFVIGLAGFILLPYLVPDVTWQLRWGVLLWYTTLGAIIGVYGVYSRHPVLHLPLPWWFRATIIGAWMNFVLTLFAYNTLKGIMVVLIGSNVVLSSPYWFVAEGSIVGLLIGYFATRFGGEGAETLRESDEPKQAV